MQKPSNNLESQLIESWQIHNRINLYLLNAIPAEALSFAIPKSRNVGAQFAHLHNVRLMWLKASAPELMESLKKIETGAHLSLQRDELIFALTASGTAIENLLKSGFSTGRIKGFKPHASAFLSYLISHESHHRGQLILTLKQGGFRLEQKILCGIWEWGTR